MPLYGHRVLQGVYMEPWGLGGWLWQAKGFKGACYDSRWGNSGRLYFWAPKSLQMVTAVKKLKDAMLLCQVNMAGWPAVAPSRWLEGIRKWYYNAAGFNKLGLMQDDTIYENDDVKEAKRSLPENLYNDRVFHIKRALDLSMRQQILPKEQWTKHEEDKFYLEPYLKEVIRERKEREEWAKK